MGVWEPREDSRRRLHSAAVSSTSLHSISHNLRLKRSFRVLSWGRAGLSINVRALNTLSLPNQTHRRRRSGPAVTHTSPGSSEMNSSLPLHHRAASWKIQPKWCDLDKLPQQHSHFCFSFFFFLSVRCLHTWRDRRRVHRTCRIYFTRQSGQRASR